MDAEQLLQLSDDEFMAQMATQQETAAATEATVTAAPAADPANATADPATVESPATEPASTEVPADGGADNTPADDGAEQVGTPAHGSVEGEASAAPATVPAAQTPAQLEAKPKPDAAAEAAPAQAVDYKAFHDKVMAPFQANGKTIALQSVDEAVQLMQMGANYTRKMQSIAPHRKVLMMLEANSLLDEGKLSRLIDLDKKNPDAIRALVKESGIDPMDIDVHGDSSYTPGNHAVPDEAVAFQTVLEEVNSTPAGQETVRMITDSWDPASKAELWKDPSILALMNQQRNAGVYDRVATEIERQRTIGAIPATVSFLDAYREIGTRMTQAGAFSDLQAGQTQAAPAQQLPVATRVVAPKPAVAHSAKAAAAAPTRAAPKRAETFINPLALSDDEFMKQFGNRL